MIVTYSRYYSSTSGQTEKTAKFLRIFRYSADILNEKRWVALSLC